MRTTIELPDNIYRALKARAALSGVTMRELVQRLIEQGLHPSAGTARSTKKRSAPPVIIPRRGVPIPAVSRSDLRRMEEEEDEARHGRPA